MHFRTYLFVAAGLVATPAFAGLGDASAVHMRQKNAICEAQRRGQGPLYPNLCQPEYPPDSPSASAHERFR